MWKKIKIIYVLIVLVIIGFVYTGYKSNPDNSIKLIGNNLNYYYALRSYKNTDIQRFKDLKLIKYNKETNKKETQNFSDTYSYMSIDVKNSKTSGHWIIAKSNDKDALMGVNTETSEVVTLVENLHDNYNPYVLNKFQMQGNKIIYTTTYDSKTKIFIKDIKDNKVISIGEFDSPVDIPVSIYENFAAYILNNRIYLYDINSKKIIKKSDANFDDKLLLNKDKIYTFKMNSPYKDLVEVNFNMTPKVILKNIPFTNDLYCDNDRIIYNDYFYDSSNNKLYKSLIESRYPSSRLLLGDYILSKDLKYEKLKENKNYIECSNQIAYQ